MDKRKRTNKNCPAWKGGRYLSLGGYWMLYIPEHSRAGSVGYAYEHVLIAEKALGKPLPKGVEIHHYGKKGDNTKLVICQDSAYHKLLHRRMRALKACGHATWRKCKYCKRYDKPENLYINGTTVCHRSCKSAYSKKWYRLRKKGGYHE